MSAVRRPLILEDDGILGRMPDNSIISISGTSSSTFTVAGKALMFDDGTSTSDTGTSSMSLQQAYLNSPADAGAVKINLSAGKDVEFTDNLNNSLLKIDSATGKVIIGRSLEVLGDSSIINTILQDSDHWQISPKSGSTVALNIEPDAGVNPIVDLITVRKRFGEAPVLRLDKSGNLNLTENLNVNGLINQVDIVLTKSLLDLHTNNTGVKHPANLIEIAPLGSAPTTTNVQAALEHLDNRISSVVDVSGYVHIQNTQSLEWTVFHNRGTLNVSMTIYDSNSHVIIPENIIVANGNIVKIYFVSPVSGRAVLFLF